jgi:hypothetical protein
MNLRIPFQSADEYRRDIAKWTQEALVEPDAGKRRNLLYKVSVARAYLASIVGTAK